MECFHRAHTHTHAHTDIDVNMQICKHLPAGRDKKDAIHHAGSILKKAMKLSAHIPDAAFAEHICQPQGQCVPKKF